LSGREHFPLPVDAPLSDFGAIAERYPVYRIDPPGLGAFRGGNVSITAP